MMMIQGTIGSLTNRLFPADRCSWSQDDDTDDRGYIITDAIFYPGRTGEIGGQTVSGAGIQISNPQLGYIGKSGRFVPITDPFFIALLSIASTTPTTGVATLTFARDPGSNTSVEDNLEVESMGSMYTARSTTGFGFTVTGTGLTRDLAILLDNTAEDLSGRLTRVTFTNNSQTSAVELQL